VDDTYRALHLSENAGPYLQLSAGPVTSEVTDLVRQELRFELRGALHRAFDRGESTLSGAIYVSWKPARRNSSRSTKSFRPSTANSSWKPFPAPTATCRI